MANSTETIERCARRGEPIPRDLLARLRAVFRTRSDDPEVFLRALEEQTERTETEYSELLKANAYDDLSCFVEFFTPDEPPAEHHEFLCEHLMAIESRDMMRLFVSMHPGAAKALALDTPILTTGGWKTIHSVVPGDYVYGANGLPVLVTGKSDVFTGRTCFRVSTDDGHSVVCDAQHLWNVRLDRRRDRKHVYTTYDTGALFARQGNMRDFRAPMLPPMPCVVYPATDTPLPVPPYTLGVWLGDGSKYDNTMTASPDDAAEMRAHIEAEGYAATDRSTASSYGILKLKKSLRDIGVLENKHIPACYFTAAEADRWAIVQGMMDTDGTVSPRGSACFTNTNKRLTDGLSALLTGLGVKNSRTEGRAKLNGVDHGPVYRVSFTHPNAFRLQRKRRRAANAHNRFGRYIRISDTDSVPTQCISVAAEDGLFLAGTGLIVTHNSKFCSKYFPAWYIGRNPFHRWLHGGHSQIFVENEFGKPVRDIVADPRYAEIFPDAIFNPRSTAAGNWRLMNGRGGYVAKGVGQKIAGYRGHCGGGDDLIGSREDAHSPTIRDKVWNWLWTDFRTRFLPAAPIFLIATRWHVDDPAGRIEKLNQEKRGIPWTMLNLNALIENEVEMALDPMGRDIGEALWADFYSREVLLDLKQTLPEMDWYALYKGRPTVTEGTMVKSAWFKRYIEYPRNRTTPEGYLMTREVRRTVLSVDTANKPGVRNNSTALTVWVESMEGYHYLVHAHKVQVDYNGLITLIEDTAREWGVQAIIVEEMGNGLTYVQQRSGKAPAPVIGIKLNRNESKEMRFESVLPIFQSGVVLLPKSAPWLHEFEDEILQFPDGASDDYADSTSQYLTWSQVKRRLGTQKLTGTAHK